MVAHSSFEIADCAQDRLVFSVARGSRPQKNYSDHASNQASQQSDNAKARRLRSGAPSFNKNVKSGQSYESGAGPVGTPFAVKFPWIKLLPALSI